MKKFSALIFIMVLILCASIPAFAASNVESQNTFNKASESEVLLSNGYSKWKVSNYSTTGYTYGGWRNGPSGYGPATLTLTKGNSSGVSITNTLSGSYSSVASISAGLGVTFNTSISQSVGYSISIPSGAHRQIIYRPVFKNITVTEKLYYVENGSYTPTGPTKTSYAKVFSHWDYFWKKWLYNK